MSSNNLLKSFALAGRAKVKKMLETNDQSLFAWICPSDQVPSALSGLLAPSPEHFRHSADFLPPDPALCRASFPSSMTNTGLHVQLYLKPEPVDIPDFTPAERRYTAILDCIWDIEQEDTGVAGLNRNISPTIQLLALGGDQYARVSSAILRSSPSAQSEETSSGDEGYRYVYVRQKPIGTVPDIRLRARQIGDVSRTADSAFDEVYPEPRWDQRSGVFRPHPSRLGSVVGAFRYTFTTSQLSVQVDFFVGIGRSSSGSSWFYWCTQRRVEGEVNLQQSFLSMQELARTRDEEFSWGCEQGGIEAYTILSFRGNKPCINLELSWTPDLLTEAPGTITVIPATSDIYYRPWTQIPNQSASEHS